MKKVVILGGGTGGTMMANKLYNALDPTNWSITVVDRCEHHYYQPGFLFIPFDIYTRKDVTKPKRDFFPNGVEVVISGIERIEPENNRVILENNRVLSYDFLIIATGCNIDPAEVEGMQGELWYKYVFDFYTIEGACSLRSFFKKWQGGRLVIHITEMPIKCPVAPLEFAFL
ncbi:MAG: FAD-dependent oxidoreductase, partial [Ignavibacteria bacterium]|nr:FAD-dependent oxidoreductase [Ignavibacteria bacterium]